MSKLINRYGETVNDTEFVKIPDNYELKTEYRILVLTSEDIITGIEIFDQYPTPEQIVYAICKYKGESAEIRQKINLKYSVTVKIG